jgi:hypothetical protein
LVQTNCQACLFRAQTVWEIKFYNIVYSALSFALSVHPFYLKQVSKKSFFSISFNAVIQRTLLWRHNIKHNGNQQNDIAEQFIANLFKYYKSLSTIRLNVVLLNFSFPNVVRPNVIRLNVILPNAILLNPILLNEYC